MIKGNVGLMMFLLFLIFRTCILVLDSLGHKHIRTIRLIRQFIAFEAKERYTAAINPEYISAKCVKVPIQPNSWDCGIFLLYFVKCFISDPKKYQTMALTGNNDWGNIQEIMNGRSEIKRVCDSYSINEDLEDVSDDDGIETLIPKEESIIEIEATPDDIEPTFLPRLRSKRKKVQNDFIAETSNDLKADATFYIDICSPKKDVFEHTEDPESNHSNGSNPSSPKSTKSSPKKNTVKSPKRITRKRTSCFLEEELKESNDSDKQYKKD
jgi:hypothetical protein